MVLNYILVGCPCELRLAIFHFSKQTRSWVCCSFTTEGNYLCVQNVMWLWYMWPSRTCHFCSHCLEHCWKGYKIQQDTRGPDYNAGLLLALDKHIVILKYLVCFLEILCLKIIRWYCLLISTVISIKQKRCICWYIFRKPTFTQIRFTIKWLPKKVIKIKQR